MEAVVHLDEVKDIETSGGNVRYVVRDGDGNEYTTFREQIGKRARELEGQTARIEFHEQQRGRYTNVYLDKVEHAPKGEYAGAGDADEAAWRAAVEAAPWLVGESEPHEEVPPEELYDKLKPFKERVAEDIRDDAAWRYGARPGSGSAPGSGSIGVGGSSGDGTVAGSSGAAGEPGSGSTGVTGAARTARGGGGGGRGQ